MFTVYRLIDPRDSKPFYIGCTENPLQRLAAHIWSSGPRGINSKRVKERIMEMRQQGVKPTMAVIEETTDKAREEYWIQHCLRLGMPILNLRLSGGLRKGSRVSTKTHCHNGHTYTKENTYIEPSNGHKRCRICLANHWKNRNEKRRKNDKKCVEK